MKVNTHKEAISTLLEIQNLIREKNENRLFKFIFVLDPNGELVLSVTSDFLINFYDKYSQQVSKVFSGTDLVKITNDFLDFFREGGEGKITAFGNHFKASFHYEDDKNWVVNNISNGPYLSRNYD